MGDIYKTTNGGENWIHQLTGGDIIYSIIFKDSLNGYAGGGRGVIYKTTNGGTNWYKIISGGSGYDAYSIDFLDNNNGWLLSGYVFKTTNSGTNWVNPGNPFRYSKLYSINFINLNTGFVVGYVQLIPGYVNYANIYKTTNGGYNWQLKSETGNSRGLKDINFINENTGWSVGYGGLILKTTNNGDNWVVQNNSSSPDLISVKFKTDDISLCISKNGYIVRTNNGGSN
jgi:photosystem II stability/assembly factor-like uncharacterized protein